MHVVKNLMDDDEFQMFKYKFVVHVWYEKYQIVPMY